MRRFGEPSDFGGIAVYLMSKASSYHTADCFVIDGGYTAFYRRAPDAAQRVALRSGALQSRGRNRRWRLVRSRPCGAA